ncbi:MAG: polysaccharide pyruvyl transferase family protein [Deltaproteobacteria bacterium]|nr:polysaccharide pyruvyl transferase family protein [Deltaproteobacteria bacterium]
MRSLTLIGSSSGRNAGDAAILSGLMDATDRAANSRLRYEIPTYRPPYVANEYTNDTVPISMFPWHGTAGMLGLPTYRSMMRTDGTLIFDNMLFDRKLYNPIFNFMSTMALFLPRAKKAGKILGCFNVGLGPVTTQRGKDMLRDIAEMMDFLAVRDEESRALLDQIGVTNKNVLLTADAAIEVAPAPKERVDAIWQSLGFQLGEEVLALNVNTYLNTWAEGGGKPLTPDSFAEIYAKAVNRVVKELRVPLLFVCTQHHDIPITENVMRRVDAPVKKLFTNVQHDHYEVKGVLGRVALLFAMRLHASILASSELTPVSALAFQKKVTSYYRLLGLSDFAIGFNRFDEVSLSKHLISAWEARSDTRAKLTRVIPELIQRSNRGAVLTARVLAGENPSAVIAELTAMQPRKAAGA